MPSGSIFLILTCFTAPANMQMKMKSFRAVLGVLLASALGAPSAGLAQTTEQLTNPPPGEWPTYGRTLDNTAFSPLDQVNRENVGELRIVCSRPLNYNGQTQGSPAVWDGVMYINGIRGVVQALDATTCDQIWEYRGEIHPRTRGLGSTHARGTVVPYEGRVYHARSDGVVVALDAKTGQEIWTTTVANADLAESFGTGPTFADGKIIVAPTGADAGGAPGRVIALDSEDGRVLWEFDVIPGPGDPVYDTWQPTPPAWERGVGGAAAWGAGGYDPVTRTIIYGTGQPNPWDRLDWRRGQPRDEPPSLDLYTASYVALDVDSGQLKWYHQVVPADEWDFDQFTTPMWVDLDIDGATRRVAVIGTVTGWLIVLDAETGELLASHMKHPDSNVHIGYTASGESIIDPAMRYDEYGQEKLVCPGLRWQWWGTSAYHPGTGLYYSPNNHICRTMALTESIGDDWQPGQSVVRRSAAYPPENFFDRLGGIEAIDPMTGETIWEYGSQYINQGGLFASAGNVVFGSFMDRGFRAFDAETGELLFEQYMPAMMLSSPITYEVDGRQYVATLVGNVSASAPQRMPGLPPAVIGPPQIFVFALP